jgi:D-alanyl-D-alanine carboxypeptidase
MRVSPLIESLQRKLSAPGSATPDGAPTAEDFDSVLSRHFKPREPGAAIIVTKDGKTLFRKAYGMADVERNIGLEPAMIFRLASLTKQFTAVAVMILADEGKLAVTDDIRNFLAGYPTQGRTITIENLLTNTSGIKSYNSLPKFRGNREQSMSVDQMIETFKNEPLGFEPGTRFSYSNSNYFLLGAIIEQISGIPYASFMAERIFVPLGLTHTAYEGHERDGSKRVEGYSGKAKARVVHMTQPYAAGGLVSNVDDLARWDAAVAAGALLKPETWKQIFARPKLRSGQASDYAYGWVLGRFDGRATQEHIGGINGFSTFAMRFPEEKLFAAALSNNDGGKKWQNVLAFLLGRRKAKSIARKAVSLALRN